MATTKDKAKAEVTNNDLQISGKVLRGAPYVGMVVEVGNSERHMWFKIDTGSDRTLISPDDARLLGLDAESAPQNLEQFVDFLGRTWTGVPSECRFFFRTNGRCLLSIDASILIVKDDVAGEFDATGSILGLDVLRHFQFCLTLDSDSVTLDPIGIGESNGTVTVTNGHQRTVLGRLFGGGNGRGKSKVSVH